MALHRSRAIANGIRTDHPVPGLPFVDDSHIPIEDSAAVEAVGRRHRGHTWGRGDPAYPRPGNGWVAYTTDPGRQDLAWVVRWHPEHGRSVLVYRSEDAVSAYTDYVDGPVLFRSGGYWWDGTTWYRPQQVVDGPGMNYYRRPVPGAVTVTADALIDSGSGSLTVVTVPGINGLGTDAPHEGTWARDLALWAGYRRGERDLSRCIVSVTAPELAAENLIGAPEFAEIAGIAPPTLRGYISRDDSKVPLPQAAVGSRSLWSRPVAAEWVEQRQREPQAVDAAASIPGRYGDPVPAGQAELASTLARGFLTDLWDWRPYRTRWALRWRTRSHVAEIADALGYEAAAHVLRTFLPVEEICLTLRHAILDDLRNAQRGHLEAEAIVEHDGQALRLAGPAEDKEQHDPPWYSLTPGLENMLTWLARHRPSNAGHVINEVIGEAERSLGIPRGVTAKTLRYSLPEDMSEYADKVLPPESGPYSPR